MTNKFKVCADDIKQGVKGDWNRCPIALAVKRASPKACAVVVGSRIQVDGVYTHRLPAKALSFIWNFESDLPVKPFKFDAEVL